MYGCKQTPTCTTSSSCPVPSRTEAFSKTKTDELIPAGQKPGLPRTELCNRAFNRNNTSYWHKNIGGYHAAKLRRYQELIERHLSPEMQAAYQAIAAAGGEMDSVDASKFRVLNMLTRSTSSSRRTAGTDRSRPPTLIPSSAWFVKNVQYVKTMPMGIDALKTILLPEPPLSMPVSGYAERFRRRLQTAFPPFA